MPDRRTKPNPSKRLEEEIEELKKRITNLEIANEKFMKQVLEQIALIPGIHGSVPPPPKD